MITHHQGSLISCSPVHLRTPAFQTEVQILQQDLKVHIILLNWREWTLKHKSSGKHFVLLLLNPGFNCISEFKQFSAISMQVPFVQFFV